MFKHEQFWRFKLKKIFIKMFPYDLKKKLITDIISQTFTF